MKNLMLTLFVAGLVLISGCIGGGQQETVEDIKKESDGMTQTQTYAESEGPYVTWQTPWDAYNPIQINGESYHITYIRYTFAIKSPDGERSYEVIKQRGYVRAHIYADDNGKKDLGEYNFFAYYGKITPINDPDMKGPLEYLILIKERTKDSDSYFLTPFPDFGAMMSGTTAIIEASYGGDYFYWSNPASIGKYSELPYTEGDPNTLMGAIPGTAFQGWMVMVGSAVWAGIEDHDLSKPDEYSFSFMGLGYSYKVSPDESVSFDGKSFRVSNVEWSWAIGNVRGQGKAKIAPALPVPVESEGTFSQMGGESYYSRLKVGDMKFSKEFEGINVGIEQATSQGESTGTDTQTGTQTETSTPELSDNWKLGWDASNPIPINGREYIVKEAAFEVDYKVSGGKERHLVITKGYREEELNGRSVYLLYAKVETSGESYEYRVYVEPSYLDEYTSGTLWIPSVYDLINGPDFVKVEIIGENCHYSIDENGNIEGDMSCGAISEDFGKYNMVWSYPTGFYGGIYGDVLTYVTLTENGNGYTVEAGNQVVIGGMTFDTYKVIWNGLVQGSLAQGNGETVVAPELPFPVEVSASLTMPGMEGLYVHARLVDLKLELIPSG
ncbi:hypothetical protein [Pyrococcus yayanosii]|uniref:Lipoprotein n=1 Tax=Pyrococcus yayanosii (strain CH1 / JCM 16557) TaxID=529709 RepID=F8AHA5_PYRYC|nr:hypothetical protein [Pyrococcus yayanosii]AEH25339.1 hypothetical protein PYCH_16790 [Pyrococcus yayanosii CH1]